MAHHKSAIKRIRTNERSRVYNKQFTGRLKSTLKSVFETKSKEDAASKLNNAFKLIDKLVSKNILHKNKAANQKSRISKYVNGLA